MEFEELIDELVSWQEADWILEDAVSADREKEAFVDPWDTWTSSGFGCLSPSSGILFPDPADVIETREAAGNRPLSVECENSQASEVWLSEGPPLGDGSLGNSSPGSCSGPNEGCKVVGSADGGTRSTCSNSSGTRSHPELEQAGWDNVLYGDSYLELKSQSPESGCSSDEQVKIDTCKEFPQHSRDTTTSGEDATVTTDEESKKLIRLMRNRESATQSRLRKKSYVKELEVKCRMLESHCSMLQQTVAFTSRENVILRDELNKIKSSNMNGAKSGVVEPAALPSDSLPSESPRRLTASGPFRLANWELLVCLFHALLLTLLGTKVQSQERGESKERRPWFRAKRCQVPPGSVLFPTLVSLGRRRWQIMSVGGRVISRPNRAKKRHVLDVTVVSRSVHRNQHFSKRRKHLEKSGRQRSRYGHDRCR